MVGRKSKRATVKRNDAYDASAPRDSASARSRAARIAAKISAAESRVLALVAGANTNKEIATVLGISPATVKRHLENILKKLQLRNRVEAAIYGLTIIGCPRQSEPNCALMLWQKERAMAD
jgi:DNA-binding NarL/FixJ family response regulator